MSTESLAQDPAPLTPDPEDHAVLLEAAKAALRWFEAFDEHASEGLAFGGEARVRKQLRRAIKRQRA